MESLVIDGVNHEYPDDNEPAFTWGDQSTQTIIAIVDALGVRVRDTTDQSIAGNKTFTDSVIITILKTVTTNPASSGQIRLAKTDTIQWRNNNNDGNLPLGLATSDRIQFNSKDLKYAQMTTGSTSGITLTSASADEHYVIPASDATYKLDNSFVAGSIRKIFNGSTTKKLTITANDNTTISVLTPLSGSYFLTPSGTPTTNTSWKKYGGEGGWVDSAMTTTQFNAVGFGTVTGIDIKALRSGPNLRLSGVFIVGTVGADIPAITLPFALSCSTSSISASGTKSFGESIYLSTSGLSIVTDNVLNKLYYNGTATVVQLARNVSGGVFQSQNGSSVLTSDQKYTIEVDIPISGWEVG